MAKAKKSRERKPRVEKPNPFDLKFANKKNMTAKGARRYLPVGKPSAARSKAIEKREKTIGVEYRRQGCANQIVDHRIAERSNLLNEEEKASLRFTAQKKKQIGKRNIFNLEESKEKDNDDDDYVFTHKGKSLSEVQRYERGEEDDNNELDGDVVALSNFGGGDLDVKVIDEEGNTRTFSRKDVLNEVISNSKNAKYIRQMAKDDITLATENIDEKYKLMKSQGLMDKLKEVQSKSNARVMEDYDEIYQTLLADGGRKAMPTLSEKEKAEREAQRLAELEKERLKRMQPDSDESDNEKHGGVDEEIKTAKKQKKKVSFNVAYDEEGNLLTPLDKIKDNEHVGADEEVDDFYADDDAEDDDNDELGDAEDEEMDEEGESEDEEVDAEDDNEDESDIEEDVEDEAEEEHDATLNLKIRTQKTKDSTTSIPFTFDMPKKYITFRDLYSGFFSDQWNIVTERLIKCYHPSLNPKNKKLIAHLFRYSLRFYDALAKNHAVEQLQPMINVLRQFQSLNKPAAAGITRSLLIYKRNHYRPAGKVVSRPPPTFDLIAFFTCVAELYPTSDHYHPVCSPTFTFGVEVLRFSQINSIKSCGIIILLAKILMKWVQESQRYIPEVINITRLLLNLAVEKQKGDFLLDPFAYRNVSRKNGGIDLLVVKETPKAKEHETLIDSLVLFKSEDTVSEECIKINLLRSLFSVVDLTVDIYDRLKFSFGAIFTPQLQFLLRIDQSKYPSHLSSILNDLTKKISDKITEYNPRASRQRKEIKKIKMIKMLDPVIDEDFDSEKPHRNARKKDPDSEVKRLKKLVRNEKRGALKELRLDASYISAAQQQKNEEVRAERNYKTKRIISSLQGQESEYKKRKMKKF